MARKPMSMQGWIVKMDDFLWLADRDVLTHAGRISAEMAKTEAHVEHDRWRDRQLSQPSAAQKHFIEATRTQGASRLRGPRRPVSQVESLSFMKVR